MRTRRSMLLMATAILFATLLLVPQAGALPPEDSTTPPAGYTPTPTEEKFGAGTAFLLIQDVLPWEVNANEEALIATGRSYDVANSATLATLDLSEYRCILYASDQPNSYYQNITTNIAKIENWVSNGGFLIAHVCDWGWIGGDWTGLHILPGNVTHAAQQYHDDLTILDPTHCKVEGLAPDYFDGWSASTHGWLTNLPAGTNKVVVVAGTTDPTYIDYDHGLGHVEATMQTVEWGYSNLGRPGLLENELKCCPMTLTVNVADGGGSGTVTSDPPGINCGVDCTEDYDKVTVVTLTAHPGVKSYVEWSWDCTGTGLTTQITVDADKTCTATFGYPVGGIVVPVDRLGLVALRLSSGQAPWMELAALAGLVALGVALGRRRRD
jgi:hypothetical protein